MTQKVERSLTNMQKNSQLQWTIEQLNQNGEVTRNQALRNHFSRLGARISDLKKIGWRFRTETRPTMKPDGSVGKDFVYVMDEKPS